MSVIEQIIQGDRLALARLITQVENDTIEGHQALDKLFQFTGKAHIIGITGPSGAGKSTLVNSLVKKMRERKRTLFKNEAPIERRHIPELFERSFRSRVWKDIEDRCLACGNCTNVCPTCYCFDIRDN